ncbi:MAG: trehalose/maltose transport system substrate-binding protein [Clostridiales bacterium]|nr:trehalose/maltose transport system substrate-binding protein [Clostridiales bacterium]MDN5281828.1 trehalose/maltose transport system substrate-binding protein [Candidatus Ozemobacter sp.]
MTFMVGGAPNELAFFEKILASYTVDTGVPVTLIRQSTDSAQRKQGILLSLRGQQTNPDVMLVDVGWIGQIAASGWLEPLEKYDIDKNVFFQSVIELADTYENKLIGLPLYIDGGLLYYRKDLLAENGFSAPPSTWAELRDMSERIVPRQKAQNPNFWGYVWQGAQYEGLTCNSLEFFTSAGGGFFVGTATPVIDQQANVTALQFMRDLLHKQPISPPNTFTDMKEEEVRLFFHNSNALFERNWPYAWGLHNADDSPIKGQVGMAPLPGFKKGQSASTLGGWHIVMSKYSDMKSESASLIKYLTSARVQKQLSLKLGWNPGRSDIYDDAELLKANPALQNLKQVFKNAVPRPVIPYYSSVSQILQKHINATLADRVPAEQALKQAQIEVLELIKDYGIK